MCTSIRVIRLKFYINFLSLSVVLHEELAIWSVKYDFLNLYYSKSMSRITLIIFCSFSIAFHSPGNCCFIDSNDFCPGCAMPYTRGFAISPNRTYKKYYLNVSLYIILIHDITLIVKLFQ